MQMNDRRGGGGRAAMDDDLQVYPVGGLIYGAREARRDVSRRRRVASMDIADDALEPIGDLVGVLVAVDERWPSGAPVELGPFTLKPRPGEERFVSLIPPSEWKALHAIEFRVFGLEQTHQPRFVPQTSAAVYEASAPQAANFHPAPAPPPDAFSDGERALRLTPQGPELLMEWYHRKQSYVFEKVGADGFMRTVMARQPADASADKGWYKADDTVFAPER